MKVTVAPATVRIRREQAATATITIARNGREGAVTLEVLDLPAGVTADATTFPPGQSEAQITFRAMNTAAHGGPRAFRVRATTEGDTAEAEATVVVAGRPSTLDTSFGEGGVVKVRMTDRPHDEVRAVAIRPSGGIIVAGEGEGGGQTSVGFLLALTPEGAIDTSFASGGKILGASHPGEVHSSYQSAVVQPDDRLLTIPTAVVGASTVGDLRRLMPDGTLDSSFGVGGRVAIWGGNRIAIRPTGGLLVLGSTISAFDAKGAVDTSFGSGGTLGAFATDYTVDGTGRILTCHLQQGLDFVLRRYTPAGVLDPTFGSGGAVTVAFPLPRLPRPNPSASAS